MSVYEANALVLKLIEAFKELDYIFSDNIKRHKDAVIGSGSQCIGPGSGD